MKNLKSATLIALLGAMLALPALAQPGPGAGGTAGGPCVQGAGGPGCGMGPGPGAGGGRGMGPGGGCGMRFDRNNTPGWNLMTPEEQAAHREKMLSAKTYEECKAYQAEHRKAMEERAREKGVTLPAGRQAVCDRMKSRGFYK